MTIQELIAKFEKQRQELANEAPYFLAASTTHADVSERIFTKGQNADGNSIGKYNTTKPLYIDALATPQALPKSGKNGDTVFKNGKAHRSTYFESYRDFKAKIGRESSFVNLQLFGNLMTEFSATLKRDSATQWYASISREDNIGKALGAEARYGTIFKFTMAERETYIDTLTKEINKILND